jgi:hypothetical protein
LTVSAHAAQRITERGISIEALEMTLGQTPFQYFHGGTWKTGVYDPVTGVFAGSVNGRITTVIGGVKPSQIADLMRAVP